MLIIFTLCYITDQKISKYDKYGDLVLIYGVGIAYSFFNIL